MTNEGMISERSIIFSSPSVRTIQDGKKTQTRRPMKPQPSAELMAAFETHGDITKTCPYGRPGDLLRVRETWRAVERESDMVAGVLFHADETFVPIEATTHAAELWIDAYNNGKWGDKWRPSIVMPRWASRITLEVTAVRVERVKSLTNADAIAEAAFLTDGFGLESLPPALAFQFFWHGTYAKRGFGWDANPYVWVVEFRRVNDSVKA